MDLMGWRIGFGDDEDRTRRPVSFRTNRKNGEQVLEDRTAFNGFWDLPRLVGCWLCFLLGNGWSGETSWCSEGVLWMTLRPVEGVVIV
jgi:hypothetical protein